ncbi:MAG TPA: hypothetical protein VH374_17260 [Polyangia bacterium]|nr:hypothetical protein [Polyangia bacterium]
MPLMFWLALSFAGPVVAVEGDSICPLPQAVAARLGELLPGATLASEPDVALLDDQGASVRIQVRRADGTPIGERVLERTFPCPDLAGAAAVIIATFESDVHPEFRLALATPLYPPAPPPVAVTMTPTAPARAFSAAYEIGAAVTGSLAPSSDRAGAAAGALIVGGWTPAGRGLGGRLSLQASTARTLALGNGNGTVQWRRFIAGLGPQWRWASRGRGVFFDLHADALGALVLASGGHFINDQDASGLDIGGGLGARLMLPGRLFAPWVDLSAYGWLRRQVAYESPSGASVSLPRIEGILALGLSFCACP